MVDWTILPRMAASLEGKLTLCLLGECHVKIHVLSIGFDDILERLKIIDKNKNRRRFEYCRFWQIAHYYLVISSIKRCGNHDKSTRPDMAAVYIKTAIKKLLFGGEEVEDWRARQSKSGGGDRGDYWGTGEYTVGAKWGIGEYIKGATLQRCINVQSGWFAHPILQTFKIDEWIDKGMSMCTLHRNVIEFPC